MAQGTSEGGCSGDLETGACVESLHKKRGDPGPHLPSTLLVAPPPKRQE